MILNLRQEATRRDTLGYFGVTHFHSVKRKDNFQFIKLLIVTKIALNLDWVHNQYIYNWIPLYKYTT